MKTDSLKSARSTGGTPFIADLHSLRQTPITWWAAALLGIVLGGVMLNLAGADLSSPPDVDSTADPAPPVASAAPQFQPALTVSITPPAAIAAGAAWRLEGETVWRESGVAYTNPPSGLHFLEFKPVEGWIDPGDDFSVWLSADLIRVLGPMEYQPAARYPITVSSSTGGHVEQQNWQPMAFNGVFPPLTDGTPEALSREWERARREMSPASPMPRDNAGIRVRLHALAAPGYRFVGWTGEAVGTRNPMTFVIDASRTIRAAFARSLTTIEATQAAETYPSPGGLIVHGQFNYRIGDQLQSLEWRPNLPPGWTLASVDGLGGPIVDQETVRFQGSLGFNPIQFNLTLRVPAGETGRQELSGEVTYQLVGETRPSVRPVTTLTSHPTLQLVPGPSLAARLELEISNGRPVVTVHGLAGRTYVIEQIPELFESAPFNRRWWYLGDVALTNSPQTFVDTFSEVSVGRAYYRATAIE